jgi:hypothetical protein
LYVLMDFHLSGSLSHPVMPNLPAEGWCNSVVDYEATRLSSLDWCVYFQVRILQKR